MVQLAGNLYLAAMTLHNAFRYTQAQTRAAGFAGHYHLGLIKTIEYLAQGLFGHPNTPVLDTKNYIATGIFYSQIHLRPWR
jgi:hypothetical protein